MINCMVSVCSTYICNHPICKHDITQSVDTRIHRERTPTSIHINVKNKARKRSREGVLNDSMKYRVSKLFFNAFFLFPCRILHANLGRIVP